MLSSLRVISKCFHGSGSNNIISLVDQNNLKEEQLFIMIIYYLY